MLYLTSKIIIFLPYIALLAHKSQPLTFRTNIYVIKLTVAVPALRDADARLGAPELLLLALVGRHRGAALLVGRVVTVGDAVALVRLVHALLQVVALELHGRARDRRAVLLVRVVEAVWCW